MALRHDFRSRPPEQVRVVVFGATGYIGRFVVRELVERGYQVVAFARERSGIGGRQSQEQVINDLKGAEVRFGDVTDPASIAAEAFNQHTDVVVSCLASRTGGRKDSWAIDHQATLNTYREGRRAGVPTTFCSRRSACRNRCWNSRRRNWPLKRNCRPMGR